jgi:hypothetical protein
VRAWLLPAALVGAFPFVLFPLAVAAVVLTGWRAARSRPGFESAVRDAKTARGVGVGIRAAWLAVALAGLGALVGDISALA